MRRFEPFFLGRRPDQPPLQLLPGRHFGPVFNVAGDAFSNCFRESVAWKYTGKATEARIEFGFDLAPVQRIVTRHGNRVRAGSTSGQGAIFPLPCDMHVN